MAFAQPSVRPETIARGTSSALSESRQMVIRDATEWARLWEGHAPGQPVPAVDFTLRMVVAVFLGERPTSGYDVEIRRVTRSGADLTVEYVESRPPAGAMSAMVLTSPYHIISLPANTGLVHFKRVERR